MKRNRALVVAMLAFVLAAAIGGAFVRLLETRREELRRRAAVEAATTRAYAIEKQLDRAAAAATAAAILIEARADTTSVNAAAREIRRRFPIVVDLDLAPASTPAAEARYAVATRQFVLGTPVSHGREGLVSYGYFPIFQSEHLHGVMVILVKLHDLLGSADLSHLTDLGFDYSIEGVGAKGNRPSLISRSTEMSLRDPVTVPISAPGGEWRLSIVPRGGWRTENIAREAAVVVLASLLVSLFVYDLLRRPERLEREVALRAQRLVDANRKLMTEMTERERAEELARHEATHDQLTSLANRPHLLARLARLQDRTDASSEFAYAVIVLNLDRFKSVNDSLGPVVADKVLVQLARRVESAVRPEDTVGRIGGDEFAVLLFGVADVLSVSHIAGRVQEQIQRGFEEGEEQVYLSASIGIAFSATGYTEPEQPLRDAHLAMQAAKEEGGARQVIFDRRMREQAVTLSNIERELRPALERNEMRVFYQPIVSLSSGRVSGFEALVRWKHPQRGFISPGLFLPVAEATGLVLQLDRWVLREAVHHLSSMNGDGRNFSLSVNLSGKQFADPELVSVVERILSESGLAPEQLRLEITESVMMRNAEASLETLKELKRLNVRISLDDFGTGYSSLSYIRQFPLDVLKIDRSFVSRMTENSKDEEIVRIVLGLASTLGLHVVAEGVETPAHLSHLRSLGCDYGQGYLFSKPVDAPTLQQFLATNPRW